MRIFAFLFFQLALQRQSSLAEGFSSCRRDDTPRRLADYLMGGGSRLGIISPYNDVRLS